MKRVLDFAASAVPELRYQKGWNRFASDWIVAIADPRAAKDYGTPYDIDRRLTNVHLPEVANTSGSCPEVRYAYVSCGSSYNDKIELLPNLESITDPKEASSGGSKRVRFAYGSGAERDRVTGQTWGTGESATISYPCATSAMVTVVFGQERRYTFTENNAANVLADRAHVTALREHRA